jgi:DNA (cytosine-5)-methyltransferase 1
VTAANDRPFAAVDLFCGVGGLSEGLKNAGFHVLGAVDIAPLATAGYALNHPETRVWTHNLRSLSPVDVMEALGIERGQLDLLAGCPPCQGFSTMRTLRKSTSVADKRNSLARDFGRFAEALLPRAILMENVPGLVGEAALDLLMRRLERCGYALTYGVLDAADFGVPQRRRRFVMLGVRDHPAVAFAEPRGKRTVRDALGSLPAAGQSGDAAHDHGERRTLRIRRLIASIPRDGGGQKDLPLARRLGCHQRTHGFFDVYGRMWWDRPAPTITSGCINPSRGRFLHPDENRAITLREAALLQGFPDDYKLPLQHGKYRAADLIGNALPPPFVAWHANVLADALKSSIALP